MKIICQGLKHISEPITEPKSFVKYMLPLEEADLLLPKKYVEEKDLSVKSPDRQKVICPIFYECGGCDLLHVKYEAQLKMKEDHLKKLFHSLYYRGSFEVNSRNTPGFNHFIPSSGNNNQSS